VNYSQERYNEIKDEVSKFLTKVCIELHARRCALLLALFAQPLTTCFIFF
jgi:hypothetical protein